MKTLRMATEIYNEVGTIRIVNNGAEMLVSKMQIRTIDTIRDDAIRIDIGEGALKNIYIRYADVTIPKGIQDIAALRDLLNTMLQANLNGFATEAKQDAEIEILSRILNTLTELRGVLSGGGVLAPTQLITLEDPTTNEQYNGYAVVGNSTTSPIWAIQRISREKGVVQYLWADGNKRFDNIWDERRSLNYQPLLAENLPIG